ncbi:MAG: hypothetical protein ACTSU5_18090 [Promethearchaeota archaeon]
MSLLSGGLDSPVAAFLMAQYGFEPVFTSFLSMTRPERRPLEEKVRKQSSRIASLSPSGRAVLYLLSNAPFMEAVVRYCPRKLTCLLCKRMMIRVASTIAREEGAEFIVSGDILGEQASQTLLNLHIYKDACDLPFFRPLLGWDKVEVVQHAREIGTYDISSLPESACKFAPKYPETRGKLDEIREAEAALPEPVNAYIEKILSTREKIIF